MTPLTTEQARAATCPETFAIAAQLTERGFTRGRLLSYFGFSHLAALSWAERRVREPITDAAILLVLFATARGVDEQRAMAALGPLAEPLIDAGLLVAHRRRLISRALLVPIGGSVAVFDHNELVPDAVAAADDSSYHLLGCMPETTGTWLDVGTGNGFLALARGKEHVCGTDVHERGLAFAQLGSHLSGRTDDRFALADGATTENRFDLVTFNAPLPTSQGTQRSAYRRSSDDSLLERFWRQVSDRLNPGGEVLVHSSLPPDLLPPSPADGQTDVVCYTDSSSKLAFGVIRWRPDSQGRTTIQRRQLSAHHPHLTRSDFD